MRITLRPSVLHAYCKAQDITRDELARRMNVASTTTFRVEKGDTDPSPKFIAALLHETGWKFEELFQIIQDDAA